MKQWGWQNWTTGEWSEDWQHRKNEMFHPWDDAPEPPAWIREALALRKHLSIKHSEGPSPMQQVADVQPRGSVEGARLPTKQLCKAGEVQIYRRTKTTTSWTKPKTVNFLSPNWVSEWSIRNLMTPGTIGTPVKEVLTAQVRGQRSQGFPLPACSVLKGLAVTQENNDIQWQPETGPRVTVIRVLQIPHRRHLLLINPHFNTVMCQSYHLTREKQTKICNHYFLLILRKRFVYNNVNMGTLRNTPKGVNPQDASGLAA